MKSNNCLGQLACLLLLLFYINCWMSACSDPTTIGSNLIDEESLLNVQYTDTFTVRAKTILSDSVRTAPIVQTTTAATGFVEITRPYLLGTLNDPVFGHSSASIYTQVRLRQNNINLGDDLQLDSIVLSLAYDPLGSYGDLTSKTDVYVYEVIEDLTPQEPYYHTKDFAYNLLPVGKRLNVQFAPEDTLRWQVLQADTLAEVELVPQLRVRLSDELGLRLLAQSGTSTFDENTNFLQFFKGLYITTLDEGNAVAYFNMRSDNSQLTLYYSTSDVEGQSINFLINENTAVTNRFKHDYEGTEVATALQMPAEQTELLYVQAMGGLGFEVDIPYLKNLGNVILNRLELEFFTVPDVSFTYATPSSFTLFAVDNGEVTGDDPITTQITTSAQPVNEDNEIIDSRHQMTFNFYGQEILQNLHDGETLKVFVNAQAARAERAIVLPPNHSDPNLRMTVKVTYTEIE